MVLDRHIISLNWVRGNTKAYVSQKSISFDGHTHNYADISHTHPLATTTTPGFMSPSDREKLDMYSPNWIDLQSGSITGNVSNTQTNDEGDYSDNNPVGHERYNYVVYYATLFNPTFSYSAYKLLRVELSLALTAGSSYYSDSLYTTTGNGFVVHSGNIPFAGSQVVNGKFDSFNTNIGGISYSQSSTNISATIYVKYVDGKTYYNWTDPFGEYAKYSDVLTNTPINRIAINYIFFLKKTSSYNHTYYSRYDRGLGVSSGSFHVYGIAK